MEAMLGYFTQSTLVLVIGYLIYRLVFRSEGYFLFNRIYLLAVLLLSLSLPLIPIDVGEYVSESPVVHSIQNPLQAINHYFLSEITIQSTIENTPDSLWISWELWFLSAYALGVLIGVARLVFRILQLFNLVRISSKNKIGRVTFVVLDKSSPVFSFLNYVFVSKEIFDFPDRNQQILKHEQQHIWQLHTIDILFSELVAVVFWFNPFIYLINKEIRENHELLADDAVLTAYPDTQNYQLLLVTHSTQLNSQLLTHNFSYSLLKRRLFMMKNVKHPVRMLFKSVWIFVAVALMAVACSDATQTTKASLPDNVEKIDIPEANMLPEDSVHLIFGINMDDRIADFLTRLGKEQSCRLDIFNQKNELIVTLFDTQMGPGNYMVNWPIPQGSTTYSYVFLAGDNRITGNFTSDPVAQFDDEDEVYTVVEKMPVFPGGLDKLMSYLAENIKYPAQAKEKGIQGRVFINFVVEADGKVSNVKLLRGIGGGCDEEAMRVVSAMPNWIPGKQDGKGVRVSYNLPVKFALN